MKKLFLISLLAICSIAVNAQSLSESDIRKNEVTQDTKVPYRLFAMSNSWNFIELDTRTGQLWGLQYSVDTDSESFTYTIDDTEIIEANEENIGRFTLYPTANMYTFILLDQKTGKAWQVQNYIGKNSRERRFRKRIW